MKAGQFLALARVPTLTATAVPLMVGGALGYAAGGFSVLAWLDVFVVALLMQVATNAMNEYGDFRRSVDTAPGPGFAGIIVSNEVAAREVLVVAMACYAAAFTLGLALVLLRGLLLLLLGVVAILVGVSYSEGPIPISSTPFGEVAAGLTMGLVEVLSVDLASSGGVSNLAVVYSFPVSLTVMAILVANNVRDIGKDREHGRRTLVVIVGRDRGILLFRLLILLVFGWTVPAFLMSSSSASVFLVWLAFPVAVRTLSELEEDASWAGSVRATAQLHLLVGALLAASILVRF